MNQIDLKGRATIRIGGAGAGQRKGGAKKSQRGVYPLDTSGGATLGYMHGATDELELLVATGEVHVHDLHATILHLLGFNRETLTYGYAGREFRLIDVFREAENELIA